LGISCLLLMLFGWFFLWLMSRLEVGAWAGLLRLLPNFVQPMLAVPITALATPLGQISVLYVHVVTMLVCLAWSIGEGSDCVAGQIARGTMEHLLTLPIHRVTILIVSMGVSTLGAALLAGALWLGMLLGLLTTRLGADVSARAFLPGAINLWAMMFCVSGMTTLVSTFNRDRWRTIKLSGGFFVVSLIVKMIARMWPEGDSLRWLTFLAAFEPQRLILATGDRWRLFFECNGTLVGLGLAAYLLGAVVLSYRDIPVPH
jgi:ABC-2 type transport system permease protein